MKSKRGWIRIVEAFTAILILAGVVLIVVGNQGISKSDNSEQIKNAEISVLREIQLNETLRAEILSTSGVIEWNDFASSAPQTKGYIEEQRPNYLDCSAKICSPGDFCLLDNNEEKNIYAESITISSTLSQFNPKVLKMFCWEK